MCIETQTHRLSHTGKQTQTVLVFKRQHLRSGLTSGSGSDSGQRSGTVCVSAATTPIDSPAFTVWNSAELYIEHTHTHTHTHTWLRHMLQLPVEGARQMLSAYFENNVFLLCFQNDLHPHHDSVFECVLKSYFWHNMTAFLSVFLNHISCITYVARCPVLQKLWHYERR